MLMPHLRCGITFLDLVFTGNSKAVVEGGFQGDGPRQNFRANVLERARGGSGPNQTMNTGSASRFIRPSVWNPTRRNLGNANMPRWLSPS